MESIVNLPLTRDELEWLTSLLGNHVLTLENKDLNGSIFSKLCDACESRGIDALNLPLLEGWQPETRFYNGRPVLYVKA